MPEKDLTKTQLEDQLKYVQSHISTLTSRGSSHIKDISDLQRYIEMQKNILEAMYFMEGL